MKIVVLDGYTENPGDLSWKGLEAYGEVIVYDRTEPALVVDRIRDAEAIYTNKTVLTKEHMNQCVKLKFIGVLATGYNVVDVAGAAERGIVVSNVPAYGTEAVAQHTLALLLELTNHVGLHAQAVREGEWSACPDFSLCLKSITELSGKTIGIIGFGKIGQTVSRMAQAFGMKVIVYSHHEIKPEVLEGNVRAVSLEELIIGSDVITLHCPLTDKNKGMIDRKQIGLMKDGVLIINTARGALISEEDLKEALESGKVGGAAVDVVSEEPIRQNNPLLFAPNVIITPHIAWASQEARKRLMDISVSNLKHFMEGTPINVVSHKS